MSKLIRGLMIIMVLLSSGVYANKEEARITIVLKSNVNAEFFVDGESVGKGKVVRAEVNKKEMHDILVKPKGYKAKEELIEPPYYKNTSFDFYFLIGDKE